MKTAAILSTGTEILQGLYADTNAQWLSQRLSRLGLKVARHMAAPDEAGEVARAVSHLLDACDLVIMTGGLGPTEDDLTRQAVAQALGRELMEDEKAWRMIEERYAFRGSDPPPSNRVQCLVPRGGTVLYNYWGTAPGFLIKRGKRWFAALPGPPREMKPMFETYLESDVGDRFGGAGVVRVKTLHTVGISESALNGFLKPLFDEIKVNPSCDLAFLAGQARVDIRITGRGKTKNDVSRTLRSVSGKIKRRIPEEVIYGADEETLETVLLKLLKKRGLTLAVAESCTGGWVCKRLTDVPGSSEVLVEGWVTYSNEAKMKRLGVRRETLERHGAVSSATARGMALGALKRSGADIAVAITGIAGPSGGSKEKPVGLVWYGLAWSEAVGPDGAGVATFRTCFTSTREVVRLFASHRALDLVRRKLSGMELDLPRP